MNCASCASLESTEPNVCKGCGPAYNRWTPMSTEMIPAVEVPVLKDTNPKDGIGATKLPLSLVPSTAVALQSLAHLDGALKYGKWNWRIAGVRASIYVDAAQRHLSKWFHGEDIDPDNGLPHLAMAMACLNILVDSQAMGKLTDDRPPRAPIGHFFDNLTVHVGRLAAKHADKTPYHHTVKDSEC
ncbi:hypothetical protein CRM86_15935 [Pseudomonas putida]|nr:hypothetical protein CRM86_15935 [Pseudomonas putida]